MYRTGHGEYHSTTRWAARTIIASSPGPKRPRRRECSPLRTNNGEQFPLACNGQTVNDGTHHVELPARLADGGKTEASTPTASNESLACPMVGEQAMGAPCA